MLQARAPRMFKKLRSIGRLLDYHADAKRRECPVCNGTARTSDGKWCQACGMTGLVGGKLPTTDRA